MTSNNKYLKMLPTDTSAVGVQGHQCMCSVALWAVLGLGEIKSIICMYAT